VGSCAPRFRKGPFIDAPLVPGSEEADLESTALCRERPAFPFENSAWVHAAPVGLARANAARRWAQRPIWLLQGQARTRDTQIRLHTDHKLKTSWQLAEDHGTAE